MVGQFGTALVGLGQDCTEGYTGSPPYSLLVIGAKDWDREKSGMFPQLFSCAPG